MSQTVGSYTASVAIGGVPIYRFFAVEDMDLSAIVEGFYLNGDTNANAVTPTSNAAQPLPTGALLPGNLVYVDTTSANVANPNVKRPANTQTALTLPDPSNAPTVADSGAAGTFSAALYTLLYVGKNAGGFITAYSTTATVTPTASHGLNVTIPNTGTGLYTSVDVYCTKLSGGAAVPLGFLGNILAANFNAAQTFTAPPSLISAAPPASANTTGAVNSVLAGAQLGLVFGDPVLRYMPTNNATITGAPVSVLRGRFTALLDINSFEAGNSPTTVGQKIYSSLSGQAADLGLFSTVKMGTAATPDYALGTVVGFEQATNYGGPGVQQTSTYGSSAGTQASTGGVTLVRVQFDIPYVPLP